MRTVVVYESLFGDTRRIAEAIARGASQAGPDGTVTCVNVAEADLDDVANATLLIAGGPTQFHGMASRRKTGTWLSEADLATGRSQAGHPVEPATGGTSLHNWLARLPEATLGAKGAAFDTRLDRLLSGGAASAIARRLRGRLYDLVAPPEGFRIDGREGPVREVELDRAEAWGAQTVREVA
jgi:hypothetical protein